MKILEYLQKKYRKDKPSAISYAEADAFGIPYPLTSGWLDRHGDRDVTPYMIERLSSKLGTKAARHAKKGHPLSKAHVRSMKALANIGPVTVTRPAASTPVSVQPPRMPKPYRGNYIDPNSDEFLTSYQWRALRMDAIALHGNSCMCCGAAPGDGNGTIINVDHIKPRRTHPHLALDINNLQILCNVCNHGKSNRHEIDFRPAPVEEAGNLEAYSMQSINEILRSLK